MTRISKYFLEEGEEIIVSSSIIYVVGNDAYIKDPDHLSMITILEGKAYWVKDESIVTSTSKYLKLYMIELHVMKQDGTIFSPFEPNKVCPILDELLHIQDSRSFSEHCQFQTKLWKLLGDMTENQPLDDLDHTLRYLSSHVHKNFSVQELASRTRMTPASFARAFKKKTGVPPKEYLLDNKMKMAKALIVQNKGINIKDVAGQVGIDDEFYFSRLFKKREGISPTIYIKKIQNRVAVVSQLLLQDHLLSIGIQPVAAPMYPSVYPKTNGVPSYLEKPLEGTLLINAQKSISSKEIMTVNPDCIIKTSLHHGEQQALTWTKNKEVHSIDFQNSWIDYLIQIACFFGKEEIVTSIKKEMNHLEQQAKKQLIGVTESGEWAVIWVRDEEIRLYGHTNHACMDLIYQTLGFTPHKGLPESGYIAITVQELLELNPDKLLFLWSTKSAIDKIASDRYWNELNAVKNKEIHIPNSQEWDPWGPLGRKNMIKDLVNYFKEGTTLLNT